MANDLEWQGGAGGPVSDAAKLAVQYGRDEAGLIDCVARCLAKQDLKFISGSDWAGVIGERYRLKAKAVLATIAKFKAGNRTGGL